ncbi:MAG: TonB family protein [Gemmatimonadetes bacterium]|nr:TonB family protein [Gemmatimonadota bacterium]
MFSELIESRRRPGALGRQSVFSFVLHTGLVLGAIGATRSPARAPEPRPIAVDVIFELPPRPAATASPGPVVATPVPALPAPDLPAITVPTLPPTDLPAVPVGPPVDPKTLAGALRGGGELLPGLPGAGAAPSLGDVMLPSEADRAPELAPGARCLGAYPAALRSMGVGGRAVLQFVVGLDGRVDSASVRIASSSHPAFGAAAKEGVLSASCRYRPGEYRGLPVRVLVQQAAAFRLGE